MIILVPAPLFENRPERCPYGHSLALGQPQLIGWTPCICAPAQEAAGHGHGMGHLTLWCQRCHTEDHRDVRFYEPPHDTGHQPVNSGWITKP
jgi:hypothetical protein